LKSLELQFEIADLEAKGEALRTKLETLEREAFEDHRAGGEIPSTHEQIGANDKLLKGRRDDLERLRLVSTANGFVVPPPSIPVQPSPDGKLPHWTGTPLEPRNLGATLLPGTLFCQIGDPGKFNAILVVDQEDIDSVRVGQKVKIMLDQMRGDVLHSEITDVSPEELKVAPRSLSAKAGGDLVTKTDPSGVDRPASTSYQARAPLDDAEGIFVAGLKGQAKIDAGYHSLGWRLWRFLTRTFHFRL
jgi:putative peptide zinc metalloprotease protein